MATVGNEQIVAEIGFLYALREADKYVSNDYESASLSRMQEHQG